MSARIARVTSAESVTFVRVRSEIRAPST
jgi:hypothetical protein